MATIKILNWEVIAQHPAKRTWRGHTIPGRTEKIKSGLSREEATDLATKLRSKTHSTIKQATGLDSNRIAELINCTFDIRQDSWNVEIDQNQKA